MIAKDRHVILYKNNPLARCGITIGGNAILFRPIRIRWDPFLSANKLTTLYAPENMIIEGIPSRIFNALGTST